MANILKKFLSNEKLKADQVYYDSVTSLLDAVYPIGRGFIDFTNTDYSNYLGFTWERELVGMVGVGLDTSQTEFNTIGKTGGEKTHTLSISEMPLHYHGNTNYGYIEISSTSGSAGEFGVNQGMLNANDGSWGDRVKRETSYNGAGGSQPHNNLQPYKVVAYWKRVA